MALRYPNGRDHEVILKTSRGLQIGDEFDLHGRRWRAAQLIGPRPRRWDGERQRMMCISVRRS